MPFTRINVEQAAELIQENKAQVVDVRDPSSFEGGHIEEAVLITNDNVQQYVDSADFERPLIVCCYHGNMSQHAAEYFSGLGFKDTYSLDGGFDAWYFYSLNKS